MSNFYLPIYKKDSIKNSVSIYNMEYNSQVLNEFLEYVRNYYQEKHLTSEGFNTKAFPINPKYFDITNCDAYEYKINPMIYNTFCDITKDAYLNLRPLGLYMKVNFGQKMPNNYTSDEKNNILLQLKKDENFAKNIHMSARDKISNEIYMIEQINLKRQLTVLEKNMLISEFERLVVQFFDLFEIDQINYKRHHSKNFDYETPIINNNILGHDAFQKVYKKFF